MSNSKYLAFAFLAVLTAFSSCEFRPLYVEGETPVDVLVRMDWTQLGADPEGASIYFYPEDQTKQTFLFKTNSVTRASVRVPSGYYTVQVFNRTVDEFGTLSFDGLDKLGTSRAILESKLFSWVGRADTVGRTVYEPEAIVVGRTDHFYVRKVSEHEYKYRSDINQTVIADPDSVMVTPKRTVYTGNVSLRIDGIQNIRSIRAYLTGLAGDIYLAGRNSGETLVTHVLEKWSIVRDETDYTKGQVVGTFNCFGLPEQYLSEPFSENNKLLIQFQLVDGKTVIQEIRYEGDNASQNEKDLTLIIADDTPIKLPDVKPEGGDVSGFNVHFKNWEDPIDIPIGI